MLFIKDTQDSYFWQSVITMLSLVQDHLLGSFYSRSINKTCPGKYILLSDLLRPKPRCISRMSLKQHHISDCWSRTLSLLHLVSQGAGFRSPTLYLNFPSIILSSTFWCHLSPHNHSSGNTQHCQLWCNTTFPSTDVYFQSPSFRKHPA